jgi:uncharacterized protein (TIGR02118 family)
MLDTTPAFREIEGQRRFYAAAASDVQANRNAVSNPDTEDEDPTMIKMYGLLPKREDVSEAFFQDHWRTVHGPMVEYVPSIHRYVQSHRRMAPVDGFLTSPYSGIAEVWFDSLDDIARFAVDPGYTEHAVLDEPNFIDVPRQAMLPAEEVDAWGETGEGEGTKLICLFTRSEVAASNAVVSDGLPSAEGFGAAIPGATGVVRHASVGGFPGTEPAYDFVVEVYLPSLEAGSAAAPIVAAHCPAGVVDLRRSIAAVSAEVRIR